MKQIDGGICAPQGFRASAAAAGIKDNGGGRLDCALVASASPCTVAGTFTTNRVQAAPVQWDRDVCARGRARAVAANSGNANACTGRQGYEDTRAIAEAAGNQLGVPAGEVCVLSTGVIGVPLPMERLLEGVRQCVETLSPDGGSKAAEAIMTTDTRPKETAVELEIAGHPVRIGAMAKGAGMIAPNMATMLCVLTTDAEAAPPVLSDLLRECVARSFNRICVDNDMSTNDTVLCLASGRSGAAPIEPGAPGFDTFREALEAVCVEMAQALVRDGEGASKFVEIRVEGARDDAEARLAAAAIAKSQLCKTAFFGEDPNWGRLACAAGYSGAAVNPGELAVWLGPVQVLRGGLPTDYAEEDAAAVMRAHDITVRIALGEGGGEAVFWTSDLSHEYVSINADYRT